MSTEEELLVTVDDLAEKLRRLIKLLYRKGVINREELYELTGE